MVQSSLPTPQLTTIYVDSFEIIFVYHQPLERVVTERIFRFFAFFIRIRNRVAIADGNKYSWWPVSGWRWCLEWNVHTCAEAYASSANGDDVELVGIWLAF